MKSDGQNQSYRQSSAARHSIAADQEHIKQAVAGAPYGYVITDVREDGNSVVYVNRAFEELTGYQASDILGRSCSCLLRGDNSQESLNKLDDAIANKQRCTEVVRNYRKDGSLFYNELTVFPAQNKSGEITHLIWTQCDVTLSVEKERNLSKQISDKDERFSAYMQNSNEAIWRLNFHPPIPLDAPKDEQVQAVFNRGIYAEVNDAAARIYGHEQGREIRGRHLKEFLLDSNPENIQMITDLVHRKFHMVGVITRETGNDGNSIVILNNIVPTVSEGTVLYLWGASLDVTELFLTQENLRESKDKLAVQKKALEDKNIALKELIAHIELEKKEFQDRVITNITEVALPSLERIRLNNGEESYIEQHRRNLESLTSSYGQRINNIRVKLTPREMEVCHLVKNGHNNKEIARLLNIAVHTVEKHRRMARKKLGLAHNRVNLHSYLNSL